MASALSAGVLQEEEDVLVNVNLVDKERAEKNVELRKKKPDYLPYAEDESVDDLAQAGGQRGRSLAVGLWGMVALRLFRSQLVPACTSCLAAKAPLYPGQVRRGAGGRAAALLPPGAGRHRGRPAGAGAGGGPHPAAAAGSVAEHGGAAARLRVPHAGGDGEPPLLPTLSPGTVSCGGGTFQGARSLRRSSDWQPGEVPGKRGCSQNGDCEPGAPACMSSLCRGQLGLGGAIQLSLRRLVGG